jgi:hypothetical protein
MTERPTHRVFAKAAGLTAEVFQGGFVDCVKVACGNVGTPIRDHEGEEIGKVEHTWVEEIPGR